MPEQRHGETNARAKKDECFHQAAGILGSTWPSVEEAPWDLPALSVERILSFPFFVLAA